MFGDGRRIGRREDPFVNGKDVAGFQNAVDLRVYGCQGRGVQSGLNGVNGVEGIGGKGDVL